MKIAYVSWDLRISLPINSPPHNDGIGLNNICIIFLYLLCVNNFMLLISDVIVIVVRPLFTFNKLQFDRTRGTYRPLTTSFNLPQPNIYCEIN